MKIGSSLDNSPAADGTAAACSSRAAPQAVAGRTADRSDRVSLSAAGAQIGALGGMTEFDQAKVDAIRQAIREGRFEIDAEAVADRLIADARALLGPRVG